MATVRVGVKVRGDKEVIRAARKVPGDGRDSLQGNSHKLAVQLAARAVRNAVGRGRQAARAAESVRVVSGAFMPTIEAGGTPRADAVLFGSEFGATRKFGWYSAKVNPRYYHSRGKQFPRHLGSGSYWFHRAVDDERGTIERTWREVLDDVIRKWSA